MKLYVFGNGFDLAHGFKTKYQDYYLFIKNNVSKNEKWNIVLDYYPENYGFWSDAEENVCKINPIPFLNMKKYFDETELDTLYDKIHESFEMFILETEMNTKLQKPLFTFDQNSLFITFNYTKTLEEIYGIKEGKIIHMHNTATDAGLNRIFNINSKECILGHSKQPNEFVCYRDNEIGKNKDYVRFVNRTTKDCKKVIEENHLFDEFAKIQNVVDEVVFYGFSFSLADKEYVQLISMMFQRCRTKFVAYYYSENDEDDEVSLNKFKDQMIRCACDPTRFVFKNSKGVFDI